MSLESNNIVPSRVVPRNRLIMLRFLEGQKVEDIALYFELQPSTINGILNSPLVRQEMEAMSERATERVANLTDEALDKVRDTMRGKSNSELQYKAANSLLDRNPELNPKKDSSAKEMMEGLGEGMIRAIGKQLREMERPNGSDDKQGVSSSPILEVADTSEVSGRNDSVCDSNNDGE